MSHSKNWIVIIHYNHTYNSILISNFPSGISDAKSRTWSVIIFVPLPLVMSNDVKCDVHSFFCVRPFKSVESGQVNPCTSCLPIISTYFNMVKEGHKDIFCYREMWFHVHVMYILMIVIFILWKLQVNNILMVICIYLKWRQKMLNIHQSNPLISQ